MVKYSTGLLEHLAVIGSMKAALDGMQISIYSGVEPASANSALPPPQDAQLLVVIDSDGLSGREPITWEAGVPGVLKKHSDETWNGVVLKTGKASWFRIHASSDDGSQSEAIFRVQGSVGAFGKDINLTSGVALEQGAPITLNSLYITFLSF